MLNFAAWCWPAACEALTTLSFNRAAARFDLGSAIDAPILRLTRFFNELGDVQQRLGRDAPTIQADAAGIDFGIDERNFEAEVGRQKSSGVTTRSAAHNCEMQAGIFCHEFRGP
jgi:hypothetical protein